MSATFHGRDVFSVAAHLANGVEPADAGEPLEPSELAAVELPEPREEEDALVAHSLIVDRFGNAGLNVDHDRLAGRDNAGRDGGAGGGWRATWPSTPRPSRTSRPASCWSTRTPTVRSRSPSTAATPPPRSGSIPTARSGCGRDDRRPARAYRVTDSTNERAKLLAEAGARTEPWSRPTSRARAAAARAAPGARRRAAALLLSLIVRDSEERHALLPLAAAVAVCDALPDLDCRIKWPNDVWVDGRKLCGILLEGRPQEGWAVLGIGLNVNLRVEELPEELRETATSVATPGGERNLDAVRCALTRALGRWIEAPAGEVLAASAGATRSADGTSAGPAARAAPPASTTRALVETGDGIVELNAGEIHISDSKVT